ncbi:MAG: MATE family efflux transporter [Desulfoplanes sp.]
MQESKRMGTESIGRLLVSFSVPAIVATVVTSMYNVVDRMFIGNGVGSQGIAAVSICFPIMLIMIAFGMLIGRGGNALVSIRLGQKRKDDAEMILGNALGLYLLLGLVFTLSGLTFIDPLLFFFGASEAVLPMAREYLFIILLGSTMHELSFGMNNFIRGEGNPTKAMVIMLVGAGLNVALDPLFIFGLDMGMQGAALATVLSQTVSALWVVHYYVSGSSLLKLQLRYFIPRWTIVKEIVAIGSPPLVMNLAACLLQAVLNHSLVRYGGDVAVSVMGVIFSAFMLLMMPLNGLCQGAQPLLGYNYGAGRPDRVRKTLLLTLGAGSLFALVMFILIQVGAGEIFQLFNAGDASFVAMGRHAIRINAAMLPLIGFQFVTANYFQAIGNARVAMFLSLSRQVVLLLPMLVVLPLFLGLEGLWMAGPLSDLASALIAAYMLARELGSHGRLSRQRDVGKAGAGH